MRKLFPTIKINVPEHIRGHLIYDIWIISFVFFIASFLLLEISLFVQILIPTHAGETESIVLAVVSGILAILTIALVGGLRIFCARNKLTKSYYELLEDIFNSKNFWKKGYTFVSIVSFLSTYISLPLAFIALGMSYGDANAHACFVISIVAIVLTGCTVIIFLFPIIFLAIKNFFVFHLHGTHPIYERWDHNSMLLDIFLGLKDCEPEVRDVIAQWLVGVNRLIQEVILSILIMEKFAHHRSWPHDVKTPIDHFKELTGVNLESEFWHHWKKTVMRSLVVKIPSTARSLLHNLHKHVDPNAVRAIHSIRRANFAEIIADIKQKDPEIYQLFTRVESRHFNHGFNPFDAIILWNCVSNADFAASYYDYVNRYGRSYNAAVFMLQSIFGVDITNRFWNIWKRHVAKCYCEK